MPERSRAPAFLAGLALGAVAGAGVTWWLTRRPPVVAHAASPTSPPAVPTPEPATRAPAMPHAVSLAPLPTGGPTPPPLSLTPEQEAALRDEQYRID
jgi:uncharacterized iron-regulated membrane protein